jgi:P27 family predicted phage terminase small subunit
MVVSGRGDELKRNPACAILKAELDQFRRFCEAFGLDPNARQRYGLKLEKKTKMHEFIDL